jgi:primary-amine oxidase
MAALLAGQRGSTSVEPDGGLPDYIQSERNLVDADVVIRYTFGTNHVVRPEDWPVMPVHPIGFKLIPSGFFAGNPALDNPAPSRCHLHG